MPASHIRQKRKDAMYAILRQGGHQYRVAPGDVLQIEAISAEPGETLQLEDVLLLRKSDGLEIGEPRVNGAAVEAKVIRHGRGRKVRVYKFKRRKGFSKTRGHRHAFTEIRIDGLSHNGQKLA